MFDRLTLMLVLSASLLSLLCVWDVTAQVLPISLQQVAMASFSLSVVATVLSFYFASRYESARRMKEYLSRNELES